MTDPVVIVGLGMLTAVGLSAAETAASVRSGTMRFGESPFRDKRFHPITLAEIPDGGLPPVMSPGTAGSGYTSRELRLLRLASPAMRESLTPIAGRRAKVGLCLALPEAETTRPFDRRALLRAVCALAGNDVDVALSDASHTGRAGGLTAIGHAAHLVQQGFADFMVAGSIDSYRDPFVLAQLEKAQRLKSAANMDGFIPGEGAGFLLLGRSSTAGAHGLAALASVSPVADGFEPGHLASTEPYRGDGLAAVLRQLTAAGAVPSPVGEVYSSMNGESHWAKEWGVAYLRNKAIFQETHGMHHPADCFGDTGAACGPVLVGLAALGIKQGYRRAPALVYGSSDSGPRSALVVSATH